MKSLILALLCDPLGVSRSNYKTLMDIYEDETNPEKTAALEDRIQKVTIDGFERYRIT